MTTLETTALPGGEDLKLVLPGRGLSLGAGVSWVAAAEVSPGPGFGATRSVR